LLGGGGNDSVLTLVVAHLGSLTGINEWLLALLRIFTYSLGQLG